MTNFFMMKLKRKSKRKETKREEFDLFRSKYILYTMTLYLLGAWPDQNQLTKAVLFGGQIFLSGAIMSSQV